jgi:hypothetical protein
VSDTTDWAAIAQKLHQDCRQLERELADANTVSATLLTTKCRELAEVTKQRDEVTMALQNLIESLNSTNWSSWQCTSMFWKQKDAAEATLAAMKGGQP